MFDLANWHDGAGPGPWILLFPLIWATVIVGAVFVLRRTVWRGRGPWHGRGPATAGGPAQPENSSLDLLGRRFAAGEIEEDEYRRRLSVLQEGDRPHKDGPA
ncbi:MAG TPA: SHOCT domain-containing protein [Streptomyces sp.]|jgi:putative membrane protein|nr:SHOCT domain-containing protein [Streptomyces sp.]